LISVASGRRRDELRNPFVGDGWTEDPQQLDAQFR
jgi:hypothetical protein